MKRVILFLTILFLPLLAGCTPSEEDIVEVADTSEIVMLNNGTYTLDTDASTLYWEAYKPIGGHMGGIKLESGEFVVQNGQPHSGSFIIDMTSITNTDIENDSLNTSLVNHLKSDDFFATADYTTARFDITKVMSYTGEDDYDFEIKGDLSLRDVTDSITLYARMEGNGNRLTGYGKAEVNRTKYNITIRSGSFFEELGDQLVKDNFDLEMDLVANRVQEGL